MNNVNIILPNSQINQKILIVHIIINKKLIHSLMFFFLFVFLNLIKNNSFTQILLQQTF